MYVITPSLCKRTKRHVFFIIFVSIQIKSMGAEKIMNSGQFMYRVEDVFRTYYAPLCYFASNYIKEEGVVEDLVQDLFTGLIEKKTQFQSELHLKNFLYISVKNACLNCIRRDNSRERYLKASENQYEEDDSLVQHIIATEVYKELAAALANLPNECRKVFEACYFEGLDNEKAAEKLGISIFTVKAQKARGKKLLKENLKDLFPLIVMLFDML